MVIIKRFSVSLLDLYFSNKLGILFIKHRLGLAFFFLPSYFFFRIQKNKLQFLFVNKFFFNNFLINLFNNLKMQFFFFIKLRIRGLGYRLYSICDQFHYFFFNYTTIIILIIRCN